MGWAWRSSGCTDDRPGRAAGTAPRRYHRRRPRPVRRHRAGRRTSRRRRRSRSASRPGRVRPSSRDRSAIRAARPQASRAPAGSRRRCSRILATSIQATPAQRPAPERERRATCRGHSSSATEPPKEPGAVHQESFVDRGRPRGSGRPARRPGWSGGPSSPAGGPGGSAVASSATSRQSRASLARPSRRYARASPATSPAGAPGGPPRRRASLDVAEEAGQRADVLVVVADDVGERRRRAARGGSRGSVPGSPSRRRPGRDRGRGAPLRRSAGGRRSSGAGRPAGRTAGGRDGRRGPAAAVAHPVAGHQQRPVEAPAVVGHQPGVGAGSPSARASRRAGSSAWSGQQELDLSEAVPGPRRRSRRGRRPCPSPVARPVVSVSRQTSGTSGRGRPGQVGQPLAVDRRAGPGAGRPGRSRRARPWTHSPSTASGQPAGEIRAPLGEIRRTRRAAGASWPGPRPPGPPFATGPGTAPAGRARGAGRRGGARGARAGHAAPRPIAAGLGRSRVDRIRRCAEVRPRSPRAGARASALASTGSSRGPVQAGQPASQAHPAMRSAAPSISSSVPLEEPLGAARPRRGRPRRGRSSGPRGGASGPGVTRPRSRGSTMSSTLATAWIARPAPTRATSSSSRRQLPPGPTSAASGPATSQAAVVWSSISGRWIRPQPMFSLVTNLSFL